MRCQRRLHFTVELHQTTATFNQGCFLKIVYRHLRLRHSPQVVEMFSFPANELNFVHFGNKRSRCTCAFSPTIICTDLVYF